MGGQPELAKHYEVRSGQWNGSSLRPPGRYNHKQGIKVNRVGGGEHKPLAQLGLAEDVRGLHQHLDVAPHMENARVVIIGCKRRGHVNIMSLVWKRGKHWRAW